VLGPPELAQRGSRSDRQLARPAVVFVVARGRHGLEQLACAAVPELGLLGDEPAQGVVAGEVRVAQRVGSVVGVRGGDRMVCELEDAVVRAVADDRDEGARRVRVESAQARRPEPFDERLLRERMREREAVERTTQLAHERGRHGDVE